MDGTLPSPACREAVTARRYIAFAAAIIVAVGFAAYADSFSGPFVFDDASSITANPTIRQLWPPWEVLATPRANVTVQGRPVLNFSFAINYAISRADVGSYHAVNLGIHLLAGLTLFGLVRRTLMMSAAPQGAVLPPAPLVAERAASAEIRAVGLAFAVALLWTVHPLQTESVTYVVQRAESLMGLFYLLTLYGFARYAGPDGTARWGVLSCVACLLGMATKEVMVSAPVIVLLYDRTFAAGSFRAALIRRRTYFACLASTWLVLGLCLLRGGGNRGGAVGFGSGVAWWTYAQTQFEAIGRYLLLSVWPHPLVFEYGAFTVQHINEVLPWALLVVPLLAGTIWAFWRRPAIGFLGAWFFALLAPTSLVPGTSQMVVEHRMYLSLAAVLTLILGASDWAIGQLHVDGVRLKSGGPMLARLPSGHPAGLPWRPTLAFLGVVLAVAVGFVGLTAERNATYRSEVALWADTVAKRPANPVAHAMMAEALLASGRPESAQVHYETAVRIDPTFFVAHERLGELLIRIGRPGDAAQHIAAALQLRPDFSDAHNHLGVVLAESGRAMEALVHFERAIALKPDYAEAHSALANALADLGRHREAIGHYQEALRLKPDQAGAEYNYANALAALQRGGEAIDHYRAALRLRPNHPAALFNLANTLAMLHRVEEAAVQYREAIRLQPDFAEAEMNLGSVLFELGRRDEAEVHYLAALRLNPQMDDARESLARLRAADRR